jgi:hypothetical protein
MKGARSAKRTPWSRVRDRLDAHNVRVAADIFHPARGEQNARAQTIRIWADQDRSE